MANFPIKLPASVQSILRDYDDYSDESSGFHQLYRMYRSDVCENEEQLKALIREIHDQVDSGGLLGERIADCYDHREAIGLRARARGLRAFLRKYETS